jgi:hypothetical protein
MDLTQKMRNVIRAIVGMPEDPGQAPIIDRLAWYEAQVTAWASDGSSCDLQPFDSRISPENGVKVLVGIPGSSSIVQPGQTALVMLGWERGDPSKPRCIPIWEAGATVTKLSLAAAEIDLAGNAYSMILSTLVADLKTWVAAANAVLGGNCVNGAPISTYTANATALAAFATSLGAAGAYLSTKVKNG